MFAAKLPFSTDAPWSVFSYGSAIPVVKICMGTSSWRRSFMSPCLLLFFDLTFWGFGALLLLRPRMTTTIKMRQTSTHSPARARMKMIDWYHSSSSSSLPEVLARPRFSSAGAAEGEDVGLSDSPVGALVGEAIGEAEGARVGAWLGVGARVGLVDGLNVGIAVGPDDVGVALGALDGAPLGAEAVGARVGLADGLNVGIAVGSDVGMPLGASDGTSLGAEVGIEVGKAVGVEVGRAVGAREGLADGLNV